MQYLSYFCYCQNISEIWFQYLVYYTIHTCNTYDNRYTEISTSDIYDIFFHCERNTVWLLWRWLSKKIHGNQKCMDTYQQNHVYFVNIACKYIMVIMLITTNFVRTVNLFICVLNTIPGEVTTHSISLIFI